MVLIASRPSPEHRVVSHRRHHDSPQKPRDKSTHNRRLSLRRGTCAVVCCPPVLANLRRFTHNSHKSVPSGGFMAMFRIGNFGFGLMLATAFSVSMLPTSSQAYTPEQEQACTSDAFRLCS